MQRKVYLIKSCFPPIISFQQINLCKQKRMPTTLYLQMSGFGQTESMPLLAVFIQENQEIGKHMVDQNNLYILPLSMLLQKYKIPYNLMSSNLIYFFKVILYPGFPEYLESFFLTKTKGKLAVIIRLLIYDDFKSFHDMSAS